MSFTDSRQSLVTTPDSFNSLAKTVFPQRQAKKQLQRPQKLCCDGLSRDSLEDLRKTPLSTVVDDSSQTSVSEDAVSVDIHRLVEPLHTYFLCVICQALASKPVECRGCRKLVCARCATICKCESTKFIRVNPYVQQCLNMLPVQCRYLGCSEVFPLGGEQKHDGLCAFKEVKCANSKCENRVRVNIKGNFCGIVCCFVSKFQAKRASRTDSLEEFKKVMEIAGGLLRDEIEVEEGKVDLEQKMKTVQRVLDRREFLWKRLEEIRNRYHPGIYSQRQLRWTCCYRADKLAKGCRSLQ